MSLLIIIHVLTRGGAQYLISCDSMAKVHLSHMLVEVTVSIAALGRKILRLGTLVFYKRE